MAFKMKGNPAKMGMIKGTAGHSSAMKMKKEAAMKMKSPMEKELVGDQNNLPEELKAKIEASPAKQLDPKVEKALKAFDRPTPAVTPKKLSDAQVKAIRKSIKEKIKDPKTIKKLKEGLKKGYMPTSPAKQAKPDYIDIDGDGNTTESMKSAAKMYKKSPNKQKVFGGTESGKGNIFTKKGRTQRKINRYKKSSDNIIKQVQKSGKDKTTGVWEDKKVKKAISKTNKRLSKTPKSFQDNLYLS